MAANTVTTDASTFTENKVILGQTDLSVPEVKESSATIDASGNLTLTGYGYYANGKGPNWPGTSIGITGDASANLVIYAPGEITLQTASSHDITLDASGDHVLDAAGDVVVETSGTQWVQFDTSARSVGIFGPSVTPSTPTAILQVRGDAAGPIVSMENEYSSYGSYEIGRVQWTGRTYIDANNWWFTFWRNSSRLGGIRGTGASTNTTAVVYETFAGEHVGQVRGSEIRGTTIHDGTTEFQEGMILVSTGRVMEHNGARRRESEIELASKPNDPRVVGVFTGAVDNKGDTYYSGTNPKLPVVQYGAVGHARILVTDKGSPANPGDLITSSSIPGYGQKQSDDLVHSYTVAKVVEQVDWSAVSETVTETTSSGSKTYKCALVNCFVYSG